MRSLGNTLAFVKVAQYLSYSKAANDLGVSKAYISKSIQQLESEVGQKLLNRTTRLVKLTREGEKFYETCLESINSIQNANPQLCSSSSRDCGPWACSPWLPRSVLTYWRCYSCSRIRI